MESTVRRRFWLEAVLASLAGSFAVLTVVWPDWIEALTPFDPDRHSGSFEWSIVFGLAVVAVAVGSAARAEWRKLSAAARTSI